MEEVFIVALYALQPTEGSHMRKIALICLLLIYNTGNELSLFRFLMIFAKINLFCSQRKLKRFLFLCVQFVHLLTRRQRNEHHLQKWEMSRKDFAAEKASCTEVGTFLGLPHYLLFKNF